MHGADVINDKFIKTRSGSYLFIELDKIYKKHKSLGENYQKIQSYFFNKKVIFDIYNKEHESIKRWLNYQFNPENIELVKQQVSSKASMDSDEGYTMAAFEIYKYYSLNPIE